MPLAADVDLDRFARITAGFSGADLANLVNEAAVMAVRRDSSHVTMADIVAALLPHTEPVHKVSIIPTARGTLGYTLQMPEEDRYLSSRAELEERLCVMLGGRAAETLIFDEQTTGAASDLERATALRARW